MALNTAADIAAFVNPVFDDALFIARDANVIAATITNFGDLQGTAPRKLQQYGSVTIENIGDSDDLSSQSFKPAAVNTLTPLEYGAQFFVTDMREESDPFGARADAARELGLGIAQSVELNLITSFSSLTTNGTIGGSGSLITYSAFYAMVSRLRQAKAPMPYTCVMGANHWFQLGKAASVGATVTNAPAYQNQVADSWFVGNVSGVNVYVSANFGTTNTTTIAMYNQAALGLDIRRAPRLEPERDASRRGLELNMSMLYAYGAWRAEWGVQGIFDNTPVTG